MSVILNRTTDERTLCPPQLGLRHFFSIATSNNEFATTGCTPLSLAATPNLTHTARKLYTSNPYTAHCRKRQILLTTSTMRHCKNKLRQRDKRQLFGFTTLSYCRKNRRECSVLLFMSKEKIKT